MGSIRGNNRIPGPDRRRGEKAQRRRGLLLIESLEDRTLLDGTTPATLAWHATTANVSDVEHGPLANAGQDLIGVYQAFQQDSGDGSKVAAAFPRIEIEGNSVGVDVKGFGDMSSFLTSLQDAGMDVQNTDSSLEIAEGLVPINDLITVAQASQTVGLSPIYRPQAAFVGEANNEAETTLAANVARQQFGVDGTGVTIGVISNSVSRFQGGLGDSVKTGDLPNNVNVLQDGAVGDPDEGRAMLENAHDVAPGASLAFATGEGGEVNFANNIQKLATTANAKVINDDLIYFDEPMFQVGIVSQAIENVATNNGVSYFSAAGNSSNLGYLSQFRPVSANVPGIGQGQFQNFNPGAGTSTGLTITTGPVQIPAGSGIDMEFDQPYYTTNKVTSQVNIYVLDMQGNIVGQGISNTVAQQMPYQFVDLGGTKPNTQYQVVIQLVSGPAPGHVEFVSEENPNGGDDLTSVSQVFGSGGGTFYPTSYGHSTDPDATGVGAVPWWGTNPADTPKPPPVLSEPFSSAGPSILEFDNQGNRLAQSQTRLTPEIAAPDGGNTSFFGFVIDTSNPPFPGEPATPSNLSQNLPSFFGTSSATPNAAAVAALMLQLSPSASPAAIRNALIASAETTPLNGTPAGTWDPAGGFGLINAVGALANINSLNVVATTPMNGATVAQAPGNIVVTFSKPVNFATVSASDLIFPGLPPGVSVVVGTPTALDDPNFPTQVSFPVTIDAPAGTTANGKYTFAVQGNVTSKNGQFLIPSLPISFTINDVVEPTVLNTTIDGRIITVQFSEPMRASTINANNLLLIRANGVNNGFAAANAVIVNNDPRFQIHYDPVTNTATLDYSALDQSELPTDHYELVILPAATDVAGNPLNGQFNGVFPSGVTPQPAGGGEFIQDLGIQTIAAPVVTSLQLEPTSDSGIQPDENTNINQPAFIGQVAANFPGTVSGLTVYAEFSALHGGNFDLAPGGGGRGFVGNFDVQTTTDANGTFVIQAPFLPEGYSSVRVVVVGQPDAPPLPGLSASFTRAFRIDNTSPVVVGASLAPGGVSLPLIGNNFSSLTSLSLDVMDPSNPPTGSLATPAAVLFPALDPTTANNIHNYSLVNLTTGVDESQFITSATFLATAQDFVSAPNRTSPSDPYFGRIDLTFSSGLPGGVYAFVAHTKETSNGVSYTGLTDAAGNPLNNTGATGSVDFELEFTNQPQATFITSMQSVARYTGNNSTVVGGPRSYYELPALGATARAEAPPTAFVIDFSNPLNTNADYSNAIQLVASANSAGSPADGDFGTLGEGGLGSTGTGFTVVPGTTVTLADKTSGAFVGQPGFVKGDRLVLQLAPGSTLGADQYRLYMPNTGANAITDIYGNQLDGEFLGDLTNAGSTQVDNLEVSLQTQPLSTATATPDYEDLMPNGQYRQGLSGDGVAGGAFMTGFTVVPNGNVIYARPDYIEDPLNPSTEPDGSLAKPYPALAPEANPATAPANPNNDPNGGLNATSNFFNSAVTANYDRNGDGHFDRSALYAAQELATKGPVIVVALPGIPQRNPLTGAVQQQTFVLQAPKGPNSFNDGSASVPFDTSLVFAPGSTLKLANAALFVQNQGSSFQVLGGPNPNQQVNFTSFFDNTIGGAANTSNDTPPRPGDWGGIVFRNFDQAGDAAHTRAVTFPVDGTLKGVSNTEAISGEDDSLSIINFANIHYAGGSVTSNAATHYDAVALYNSRPAITNDSITLTGGGAGSSNSLQAAISGDLDSFREDDTARGPLIRRVNVAQNSINGIYIRPDSSGVAEASDAMLYPDNPTTLGGSQNYTFDAPLPYVLTSLLDIGSQLLVDTSANQPTSLVSSDGSIINGITPLSGPIPNPNVAFGPILTGTRVPIMNRAYIQPGMMFKFQRGAGIEVLAPGSSLNIGVRTYINGFDSDSTVDPATGLPTSTYGPLNPDGTPNLNFKPNSTGDALVLFTSLYDNTATTSFTDTASGVTTTIVPAIDVTNSKGANQPAPGNVPDLSRWGSVTYFSGSYGIVNEAQFQYGGGSVNINGGTVTRDVLSFLGASSGGVAVVDNTTGQVVSTSPNSGFLFNPALTPLAADQSYQALPGFGTRVMVTNNNFFDNSNSADLPNDTPIAVTPDGLLSTDPLTPLSSGNPYFRGNVLERNGINGLGVIADNIFQNDHILSFNAVPALPVDGVDLSVSSVWAATDIPYVLRASIVPQNAPIPFFLIPPVVVGASGSETRPYITLTVQSALPGTLLADGSTIPKPGQSVVVKLDGAGPAFSGPIPASVGGAGFLFGVDDEIDPPGSAFVDQGYESQLRILGIGGNEIDGQTRVPAIITSVHDKTVPLTVRGVDMSTTIPGDITNPMPGDGGIIYFGGNSLTTYNAFDIREGNKVDNADIRYIDRIVFQGGGVETENYDPITTGQELTISNSNLSSFRDIGVYVRPTTNLLVGNSRNNNQASAPAMAFLVNDTIANMPVGVRIDSMTQNNGQNPSPMDLVAINNTFFNDAVGLKDISVEPNGTNSLSHVHLILMDNIFDGSGTAAIQTVGQIQGSVGEYNLFFNNAVNVNSEEFFDNEEPVFGDPAFVNAAGGNFQLGPNSAAIDAARSELSLDPTSNGATVEALIPVADQVLTAAGGTINGNERRPDLGVFNGTDILSLPGATIRSFVDQWIPVLSTAPNADLGPASNSATFAYSAAPAGVYDQLGNLRQKDPNSSNVGFGSQPFFDIGAFEYRQFFPPHVTGVTATANGAGGISTANLYQVGGVASLTQTPQSIQIQFDHNLDPTTITNQTVLLEASGGDGIFGNNNSAADRFIDLSGKLSFNATTNVLSIALGSAGLVLPTDEYRIFLEGNGANVIRDPQGNALDGENTLNDDPNNPQLALPSGDGFPGGNFYDTFTINTQASSVLSGSFLIAPNSDTNARDAITFNNLPSFSGSITDTNPAIAPLAGQIVVIDISTLGNGVFDRMNAGTAVTNANGNFVVTVGQDAANTGLVTNTAGLPDSQYNVGPTGLLISPVNSSLSPTAITGNTGYSIARLRIISSNGTTTNPNDTNAETGFIVDTAGPTITSFSPTPNTTIQPDSSGNVTFSFTTGKNIDPTTLNANSIQVTSAGPDGVLGTADDVSVPITANSLTITPLKTGAQGPELVSFSIAAAQNNAQYQVVLKGTGATPITDVAGNPLNGRGGTGGSDFTAVYTVFNPSAANTIFVDAASKAVKPDGSLANPYPSITMALTAANAGDTIAVFPGVYSETSTIDLKAQVRVLSVDPASTAGNLIAGNAQQTVIRLAPPMTNTTNSPITTIAATNLISTEGLPTELSGFTIASPLVGNQATGAINTESVGLQITNSNILVDKDYFIDSGIGISVTTPGLSPNNPQIEDDGIIGNLTGINFQSVSNPSAATAPDTKFINNTFAYNTIGFNAVVGTSNAAPGAPYLADLVNNIFWENHDLTTARNGTAISATAQGKLFVAFNMFADNGASDSVPADNASNVGGGFDPSLLTTGQDALKNFLGEPAFVAPRDPRPNADGPAIFFNSGNFDLTGFSAAIDAAAESVAPPVDFLSRGRVAFPGRGFPGTGPADVGAFEFQGTGGIPAGGAFRVVTTSLAPGGSEFANGAGLATAPNTVVVDFSANVNPSSINPGDLQISGSGVNPGAPVQATSLTWFNSHTVGFNLTGSFNPTGTVNIAIPAGILTSANNAQVLAYNDSVTLGAVNTPSPTPTATPTPTPTVTPTPTPIVFTPPPAPSPVGVRTPRLGLGHLPRTITPVVPRPVTRVVPRPVNRFTLPRAVNRFTLPRAINRLVPRVTPKLTLKTPVLRFTPVVPHAFAVNALRKAR